MRRHRSSVSLPVTSDCASGDRGWRRRDCEPGLAHAALWPLAFVVLLLTACSDRDRMTVPGGETADDFTLGPKTSYTIPPGSEVVIPDSVSGGTFVFTTGGGKVDVARILTGPAAPEPGQSFWVDYQGSGRVRLEFSDEPDKYEVLYAYGIDLGSISDARGRTKRWTCAPVAESLGVAPGSRKVRYELVMPFDYTPSGKSAAMEQSAPSTHTGFAAYHLSRLSPQSTSVQRFEAARRDAWRYLAAVIDSLPPSLGAYVAAQTASGGTYEPTFYNSDDHKYKGFIYLTALVPITSSMIFLGPNATEHVAHETGHWVNHILTGSGRYVVLEAQAPANHSVGQIHGLRSVVMEDYAHFCDYFCTGVVQSESPEEPWQLFAAFSASAGLSPSAVDWPSLEGFGTVMLASLIRKSPTIRSTTGGSEEIPVIGASFREVWPMVASGAPNITVLRDSVDSFLGRRGQRALMPALAERIGWRYHGGGRLVDDEGQPIKNARVQAIYDDGSRVWRTPGSTTTGNDGRFTLSRLFPGDSQLRVWQGTDSSDVPVSVGWAGRTDEERNLGDITIGGAILAQLQRTLFVDLNFNGEMEMSDGNILRSVLLTTVDAYLGEQKPVWNGTSFDLDFTKPLPGGTYRVTLDGTVSPSGREIVSLTATLTWTNTSQSQHREFRLTGLPIEELSIGPEELWYSLEGTGVQDHLQVLVDNLTLPGEPTVSIVSINWQSEEDPPELIVSFSTAKRRR